MRNFNEIGIAVKLTERNNRYFVEELTNDRIIYGILFNSKEEAIAKFNDICAEYEEFNY